MESGDEGAQPIRKWRDVTSMGGRGYIWYMNRYGWSWKGTFTNLLSSADYPFEEDWNGKLKSKKDVERTAPALAVLIFEQ